MATDRYRLKALHLCMLSFNTMVDGHTVILTIITHLMHLQMLLITSQLPRNASYWSLSNRWRGINMFSGQCCLFLNIQDVLYNLSRSKYDYTSVRVAYLSMPWLATVWCFWKADYCDIMCHVLHVYSYFRLQGAEFHLIWKLFPRSF